MRTARRMKALALTGIVAPVLFIMLVAAQGILQPDYSHVAMPISALAAWPWGWLQNLNFFVFATLMGAFAIGLHAAIQPTPFGAVGIALLLASAVGTFMAGVFHWVNIDGIPTETSQHVAAAVLTFACGGTGLIVLSRRMTADSRWHDLAAYVLGYRRRRAGAVRHPRWLRHRRRYASTSMDGPLAACVAGGVVPVRFRDGMQSIARCGRRQRLTSTPSGGAISRCPRPPPGPFNPITLQPGCAIGCLRSELGVNDD